MPDVSLVSPPKSFTGLVVRHAAWFIADALEGLAKTDKNIKTLVSLLKARFALQALRYQPVTLVFKNAASGNPHGHVYKQNMKETTLVKTLGKNPEVKTISVLVCLVVNPQAGHNVGGEFDDRKNRLSVYLLSLPRWQGFYRLLKQPRLFTVTAVNALLSDVEQAANHEFVHALQWCYRIGPFGLDTHQQQYSHLPQKIRYYLDPNEFLPLISTVRGLYKDQVRFVLDQLPVEITTNKAKVAAITKDIRRTITGQPAENDIVRKTTKASVFFLALRKYDPKRYADAVGIFDQTE